MDKHSVKSLIISDFNVEVLGGYLSNDEIFPSVEVVIAPFGQVIPVLVEKKLECWKTDYDFAIVWTQPERAIGSFRRLLNYEHISTDKILSEVEEYARALMGLQDRVKFVVIPTWVFPTYHRGYGMLDLKDGLGITNVLMRMNLRLSEVLSNTRNVYLLNTQKWIEAAGRDSFSPKLWYMGKIPFGNEVFKNAVRDIKSALNGISGRAKKIIIVDLDDTLWGGIVGDFGWKNIILGGHDPRGEAFVDFQKTLKSFTNRGILLGIVSKNEESMALEAINNHQEMVLKLSDFAGWRINWRDKAENIIDLMAELKLGLQSAVFIDDSCVERARVKETLPEVVVPEWPEDKMLYKKALLSLSCFDVPLFSKEDTKRVEMYAAERQRRDLNVRIGSLDEWLKTLDIMVEVEEFNEANLQRTIQLLNKTNQMNLTTRRITGPEFLDWVKKKNHKLWTFRVSDKFGQSGLTGIISLEVKNKTGLILDFVLSCRVIGRKIEETMLWAVVKYAKSLQLETLEAKYVATQKNKPCLTFFENSNFKKVDTTFTWKTYKTYKLPECIHIENIMKK